MGKKNIYVTGIGAVTPIGQSAKDFWENCLAGVSGISEISSFNTANFPYPSKNGGEIKGFSYDPCEKSDDSKNWGRSTKFGCAAVGECLKSAGYNDAESREKVGVVWGTTMGEANELEMLDNSWQKGFTSETKLVHCDNFLYQRIPQNIAKLHGLKGYNMMIPNACAAGNFAIACGYELINYGIEDALIVGGSDTFNRYTYSGFCRIGAVASSVPRPFTEDADGMVPSEGAGALLIESEESMLKRNAKPIAEVLSYGFANDSYHITQPDPEGIATAYRKALDMAGIDPEDISYISVHGTGTKTNDPIECQALRKVFNGSLKNIPLSSIKSTIGHAMGAASAIEAVVSVLAIRDNMIPPTINFTNHHPECLDIDPVPNKARRHPVKAVFDTASGFGGNNCVIIFKKCE